MDLVPRAEQQAGSDEALRQAGAAAEKEVSGRWPGRADAGMDADSKQRA
ncbi:hypothetical protein [Pseudomonas sp. ATCC 13867]|nr:hypothetical protein [Pseudomonas sp. ATCC 13867]